MTLLHLTAALEHCFLAQNNATALWHVTDPADTSRQNDDRIPPPSDSSLENAKDGALCSLVLGQHLRNFRLWHVEDEARRLDVDSAVIADCKRRIDKLNQERNDAIEQVDTCLLRLLTPLLPSPPPGIPSRCNTESLGMAIDRLSILSLKIWHMNEQVERTNVSVEHLEQCRRKLAVLHEQRHDLQQAVLDLLTEFAAGTKRPKVYFQFKMYNDPSLNPALYQAAHANAQE